MLLIFFDRHHRHTKAETRARGVDAVAMDGVSV
jgi:hypothetical protein